MNFDLIYNLFDKYKLTSEDRKFLLKIIKPILNHEEFQKRFTEDFLHHNKVTLGEHIIEVAIETFIISKKQKSNIDLELALNIAMMHDLYSTSWNNKDAVVDNFCNKHAFRHPVESVINSATWFPEIFENSDSYKLVDGICHHMFPVPVVSFKDSKENDLELRNFDLVRNLSEKTKRQLEISTNKNLYSTMLLRPSKYKEGIIVSNADKLVTANNLKGSNFNILKEMVIGEKVKGNAKTLKKAKEKR